MSVAPDSISRRQPPAPPATSRCCSVCSLPDPHRAGSTEPCRLGPPFQSFRSSLEMTAGGLDGFLVGGVPSAATSRSTGTKPSVAAGGWSAPRRQWDVLDDMLGVGVVVAHPSIIERSPIEGNRFSVISRYPFGRVPTSGPSTGAGTAPRPGIRGTDRPPRIELWLIEDDPPCPLQAAPARRDLNKRQPARKVPCAPSGRSALGW